MQPDQPPDPPVLGLRQVSKQNGRDVAVQSISLELHRGEVFALLGPNGSGKSTTLNMVLGLIRPTSGTIEIHGQLLSKRPRAALRDVGGLVEGPSFYPYLSGRKNLELLAQLRGVDHGTVDEALATVGLTARAESTFDSYSLGMKQRLGIASTLMHKPRLIVLDEPTNGLDPEGTMEIRTLIPRLARGGQTVLLSSHLLHEVEQVSDRVAIMRRGSLIAEGPMAELLRRDERTRVSVEPSARARAMEILKRAKLVTSVEADSDGTLLVKGRPDRAALNRALAEQGIYASELAKVTPTLESLFLLVTQGE